MVSAGVKLSRTVSNQYKGLFTLERSVAEQSFIFI